MVVKFFCAPFLSGALSGTWECVIGTTIIPYITLYTPNPFFNPDINLLTGVDDLGTTISSWLAVSTRQFCKPTSGRQRYLLHFAMAASLYCRSQ